MMDKPAATPRFRTAVQPLKFLDFLIEKPVQGAIANGGGVLVNVPLPVRFALHKLLVTKEHPVSMHDKTEEDLTQAMQVFEILLEERPGDLQLACHEFKKRGIGWICRIQSEFSRIEMCKTGAIRSYKEILGIMGIGLSPPLHEKLLPKGQART